MSNILPKIYDLTFYDEEGIEFDGEKITRPLADDVEREVQETHGYAARVALTESLHHK